jgi:hypothetical protein
VSGGVAQDVKAFGTVERDHLEVHRTITRFYGSGKVTLLAVYLHGDSRAGESGADGPSHVEPGRPFVMCEYRVVW